MSKPEWAAIAAATATVITALLASLAGLGEHAAGVVTGILISSPVMVVTAVLIRQVEQLGTQALQREADYAALLRDTAVALTQVTTALNRLCEAHDLENRIAELESAAQEVGRAKAD